MFDPSQVPDLNAYLDHLMHGGMPLVGGWISAALAAIPAIASAGKALFGKNDDGSSIGSVASGAASGSQDARLKQDQINAQIYRAMMEGELGKGALDLSQKKYELDAGGTRLGNVMRGDLVNNVQDFSMGGPAGDNVQGAARAGSWTTSGGMRPSALGSVSKEAANALIARDLAALKGGESFAELKYPEPLEYSKAGTLENILGGVGLGSNLLGTIFQSIGRLSRKNPGIPEDEIPGLPNTGIFPGARMD